MDPRRTWRAHPQCATNQRAPRDQPSDATSKPAAVKASRQKRDRGNMARISGLYATMLHTLGTITISRNSPPGRTTRRASASAPSVCGLVRWSMAYELTAASNASCSKGKPQHIRLLDGDAPINAGGCHVPHDVWGAVIADIVRAEVVERHHIRPRSRQRDHQRRPSRTATDVEDAAGPACEKARGRQRQRLVHADDEPRDQEAGKRPGCYRAQHSKNPPWRTQAPPAGQQSQEHRERQGVPVRPCPVISEVETAVVARVPASAVVKVIHHQNSVIRVHPC